MAPYETAEFSTNTSSHLVPLARQAVGKHRHLLAHGGGRCRLTMGPRQHGHASVLGGQPEGKCGSGMGGYRSTGVQTRRCLRGAKVLRQAQAVSRHQDISNDNKMRSARRVSPAGKLARSGYI